MRRHGRESRPLWLHPRYAGLSGAMRADAVLAGVRAAEDDRAACERLHGDALAIELYRRFRDEKGMYEVLTETRRTRTRTRTKDE